MRSLRSLGPLGPGLWVDQLFVQGGWSAPFSPFSPSPPLPLLPFFPSSPLPLPLSPFWPRVSDPSYTLGTKYETGSEEHICMQMWAKWFCPRPASQQSGKGDSPGQRQVRQAAFLDYTKSGRGAQPMVPFWGRCTTHSSLFQWGLGCSLGVRDFDPQARQHPSSRLFDCLSVLSAAHVACVCFCVWFTTLRHSLPMWPYVLNFCQGANKNKCRPPSFPMLVLKGIHHWNKISPSFFPEEKRGSNTWGDPSLGGE